jgi:3D (Asp-Asp-Asp) domain-containing protein
VPPLQVFFTSAVNGFFPQAPWDLLDKNLLPLGTASRGIYESPEKKNDSGRGSLLAFESWIRIYAIGVRRKSIMKRSIIIIGLVLLLAGETFAGEKSLLARVTVYWHSKGPQQRACFNGVRLRGGHCAVDPRRIAYGSKVLFADKVCLAIDTGPDVISRRAARLVGRTVSERNAVVIDRFFDTREQALAWARTHPHFITVRVVTPDKQSRQNVALNDEQNHRNSAAVIASNAKVISGTVADLWTMRGWERVVQRSSQLDSITRSARRRT